MIQEIIKVMYDNYTAMECVLGDNFDTLVTATTNQAVAVLNNLSKDISVSTIYSALGLTLYPNYRTGEENLVRSKRWCPIPNAVALIDEASMLDQKAFTQINETLIYQSKIILIGDVFQLNPVKAKTSAMQDLLHTVPTAVMSKVLRHSGPILEAATEFRDVVESGVFTNILLSDKVIHVNGSDFKDEVVKAFTSPEYNANYAKILSWSNKRVQDYNSVIRELKGLPIQLSEGEELTTVKPIISPKEMIPVDSIVTLTQCLEPAQIHGVNGRYVEINGDIISFLPDDYKDIKKTMDVFSRKAKNAEAQGDNKSRRNYWETYFEIKTSWLDLRSPYASTVHKAQGSTFDTVFIDLYDIGECRNPADTARLLYVSISRAKNKVVLSGELPKHYRGI